MVPYKFGKIQEGLLILGKGNLLLGGGGQTRGWQFLCAAAQRVFGGAATCIGGVSLGSRPSALARLQQQVQGGSLPAGAPKLALAKLSQSSRSVRWRSFLAECLTAVPCTTRSPSSALSHPFFGWEASPSEIDVVKKKLVPFF